MFKMADKLGILINTILNAKPEDLQKQLDSVAKKNKNKSQTKN